MSSYIYSKDYIDSFGNVPLSPYLSGEQLARTSVPLQQATQKDDVKGPYEKTWSEPSVIVPKRSMNTVVFQGRNGGSSVVINDEGEDGTGYILLTHSTGSVVQIDDNGTILIKSMGDVHNTTEGVSFQSSTGDNNINVGGAWNVKVERGNFELQVNGDINIECDNFNVKAKAKTTMNSAEGALFRAAKYSFDATADNFDVISKNIKFGASESISMLGVKDVFLASDANIHLKSKASTYIEAEAEMHLLTADTLNLQASGGPLNLKASDEIRVDAAAELKMKGSNTRIRGATVYIDDFVRMAEGGANATGVSDATAATDGVKAEIEELGDVPAKGPKEDNVSSATQPKGLGGGTLDDTGPF